ncbi:hypothetical protein [Nonomuraea sp. NPDC050643]|uniref:hypothetical protein n=1 Tax=Nonomuraea sp. NPDC050643 TaxID=3155660 RepID=UPI0033E1F683
MTRTSIRLRASVAGVAIAGALSAGLFATAPAANASVTAVQAAGAQALGGTAPACVARYAAKPVGTIVLRNKCRKTMRVKVIVKRGPDSPCWTGFRPGQIRVWKWLDSTFARYERTVTC